MRRLLFRRSVLATALTLAVSGGSVSAQRSGKIPQALGKPYPEMIKMGSEKWMEFHGEKHGHSTAAMWDGMELYRGALLWRNNELSRTAPAAVRSRVATLRKLLLPFISGVCEVGYFNSGGGTIWVNVEAGSRAEAEEVLHRVLTRVKSPGAATTGQVLRAHAELDEAVRKRSKENAVVAENAAGARKRVTQLRAGLAPIFKQAGALDRAASDHVLGFVRRQLTLGLGDFS